MYLMWNSYKIYIGLKGWWSFSRLPSRERVKVESQSSFGAFEKTEW